MPDFNPFACQYSGTPMGFFVTDGKTSPEEIDMVMSRVADAWMSMTGRDMYEASADEPAPELTFNPSYTLPYRIIFSGPVTVACWPDGKRTRTRHSSSDDGAVDPKVGLAVCLLKRYNKKYHDLHQCFAAADMPADIEARVLVLLAESYIGKKAFYQLIADAEIEHSRYNQPVQGQLFDPDDPTDPAFTPDIEPTNPSFFPKIDE